MATSKSSHSQDAQDNQFSHRPPEVDAFVDEFLSIMCDTSRRYILELLSFSHNGDSEVMPEKRSGDIARAIGLSPATTSEHLRQLVNAGLVTSRREGNVVYYQLVNHTLVQAFRDLLQALENHYSIRSLTEES